MCLPPVVRTAGCLLLSSATLLALAGTSLDVNEGYPLALGDTLESGITHVGDEDTYVFEGTSGSRVSLALSVRKQSGLSPALELLDPAGVVLSPKRRENARRISIGKFELPGTGLYAVRIGGNGDTEGAYVLKTRGKRPRKGKLKGIALTEDEVREFPFGAVAGTLLTAKVRARRGQYLISLTSDVEDTDGTPLKVGPWDWSSTFTVGPDVYAPNVRGIRPENAQTGVARDASIIVVFDESVDPATLSPATLFLSALSDPGVKLPMNLVLEGFAVTGSPHDPLEAGATFEVTVTSGVRDTAGNPATPFDFSFGTAP